MKLFIFSCLGRNELLDGSIRFRLIPEYDQRFFHVKIETCVHENVPSSGIQGGQLALSPLRFGPPIFPMFQAFL